MGKPQAHLVGGIPGRELVWEALRREREGDCGTLSRLAGQTVGVAKDYLTALCKAGIVEIVDEKIGPLGRSRHVFRLVRDMGIDAPRVRKDGTLLPAPGRQRMWRAMGILKEFSARDLAAAASLPEAPISPAEAVYYCRWLIKGGYLRQTTPGRYLAVPAMRHGPRAPMIQRVRRLLDPNTGEIVAETDPVEEKAR